MNPCSSSKNSSNDEQNTTPKKIPASNFLLLPFATPNFSFNLNTPFFRSPNPNLLTEASNAVREVQKSFLSNVDKCLNMMAQNGVFDEIISFPSYLKNCCQIPKRNRQNLIMQSSSNFAAILPGDSVAGIVASNGILNFLNIYNTILICRLVLTWFPNAPPAIVSPLSTLCDPYLNIFRGIIPPLGGTLDLSPILAFLVLNAFTSAASALPAELPSEEVSSKGMQIHTTSQKKWMRRLSGNKSKSSNGENGEI